MLIVKCKTGGQFEIKANCPTANIVWRNHLGQTHTYFRADGSCLPAFQTTEQFRCYLYQTAAYAGRMPL